jgi:hypothetical protein
MTSGTPSAFTSPMAVSASPQRSPVRPPGGDLASLIQRIETQPERVMSARAACGDILLVVVIEPLKTAKVQPRNAALTSRLEGRLDRS